MWIRGSLAVWYGREAVYRTALPRGCRSVERNAHIVVIFGAGIGCSSVADGFGVCHAFVPPCCRSASSWTGDEWLGEPCNYRQLQEGTGSDRCHIPFWGTYEPCLFFHRKIRTRSPRLQGYINRLQNSSFFFVPKKTSNLCADPCLSSNAAPCLNDGGCRC